jgi:Tfp pilus assembly protein PilE
MTTKKQQPLSRTVVAMLLFTILFVGCATMVRRKEMSSSSSILVGKASFLERRHQQQQLQQGAASSSQQLELQQLQPRHLTTIHREPIAVEDDPESSLLSALTEKLNSPRELATEEHNHVVSLTKNQFLHLHHMKTGTFFPLP